MVSQNWEYLASSFVDLKGVIRSNQQQYCWFDSLDSVCVLMYALKKLIILACQVIVVLS